MDPVVTALAEQQAETKSVLGNLTDGDWERPTRCEGWDIADVVLHLAQSDEMAIASLQGSLPGGGDAKVTGWGGGSSVDESVALMVERERGATTPSGLRARWTAAADQLTDRLEEMDLSTRVRWVAGELAARTLATTRMTETWIHTGDIASAVGRVPLATDRLKFVARLAWRTLPYAFAVTGEELSGPVAFSLAAPSGGTWEFVPDSPAVTTISGPAVDLCEVAARRLDPSETALSGEGPDVARVLSLVRTYA